MNNSPSKRTLAAGADVNKAGSITIDANRYAFDDIATAVAFGI